MGIFTGSAIGLGLLKKGIGLGALKKFFGGITLNKILTGAWINQLTGNPIGDLVNKLAGKTTTKKENLNLNNRLLNLTGKDKENAPTQEGALRFLGDRSGRQDDAPDIEATNQSVLDNIAKNQSLALGTTVAPDLDTKQSVVDSFSGLVGIIQQINNNIGAIGQAMLNSSVIESKYRQELIDDLEEEIAEKGKTRSRTRFERSIFNFATRQKNKIATKTGNLSKDLSKALLLSLGLELGDLPFGGIEPEKESEVLFGDDLVDKYGRDDDVLEEDLVGGMPPVGDASTPENNLEGIVDDISIIDADPYGQNPDKGVVLDSERLTEKEKFEKRQEIIKEKQRILDLKKENNIENNTGNNIFNFLQDINPFKKDKDLSQNIQNNNNFDFLQNINPNTNVDFSALESMGGGFQIIDMRTAKEVVGDTSSSDPTTVLDSSISSKDPSRRTSPYEGLVRNT